MNHYVRRAFTGALIGAVIGVAAASRRAIGQEVASEQGAASGRSAGAREAQAAASGMRATSPPTRAEVVARGIKVLLAMQEGEVLGEVPSQWPYEGVYRNQRGEIPVAYRIGGTARALLALTQVPGQSEAGQNEAGKDEECRAAVARGIDYLCLASKHADMAMAKYAGGYDVSVWGHIEGLMCLTRLKRLGRVEEAQQAEVDRAIAVYLDGVVGLEMPATGGWNYARPAGRETVGAPSSFVTGCALQALFEARAGGSVVDAALVERGLRVLEKAKGESGTVVYSGEGTGKSRMADAVPGAVGRMTLTETTLMLAGRGRMSDLRGSVDAFIVHWDWLEKRRGKGGTHVPPYMVAPYYFMFAHYYAAQAIEMLPASERGEYRRRLEELLMRVRSQDGSWNDRVFPRSAGYGTGMALMSLEQAGIERAAWAPLSVAGEQGKIEERPGAK